MKNWLTAATIAASIGAATLASAQYSSSIGDVTASGFDIRIGFAYSLDNNLRDVANTLIGFGIDYNLPPLLKGSTTFLSGDVLAKSGSGGHGNAFPICLNERFSFGTSRYGGTYFFVGAGAFITDVTSTNTVLGARGGFGVNLGPNIFTEATATLSLPTNNYRIDTIGLYVGYKF